MKITIRRRKGCKFVDLYFWEGNQCVGHLSGTIEEDTTREDKDDYR